MKPLAQQLGIAPLSFGTLRRTRTTQVQDIGLVQDFQAHLRHGAETTANKHMQELQRARRRWSVLSIPGLQAEG